LQRAAESTSGKTLKQQEQAARSGKEKASNANREGSNTRTDARPRKAGPSARPLLPTGETAATQEQPTTPKGTARAGTTDANPLHEGKPDGPKSMRPSDAVARKLMLEDGLREQEPPPIPGPDLGDMEM
jgi:hypothetical protein